MAKNKIERIDQEITKVREKIAEYQEKLKALEAQKTRFWLKPNLMQMHSSYVVTDPKGYT